jgi:hypothetical protein
MRDKVSGPHPEGEAHHVEDEDVLGDRVAAQPARVPHQRQGTLYAVRDPSTLFANSGSTLRGQGFFYTLCSNYENSGSTVCGQGSF